MHLQTPTKWAMVLAAAGVTASAFASGHDGMVSRAQVRAETAAAVAAGAIRRGERAPYRPAANAFHSTHSRGEVRKEAAMAVRDGEVGRGQRPALESQSFVPTRSRAAVNAETRAAMQLGLIPRGDAPLPVATPAERREIRSAGERAHEVALATR